MMKVFFAALLLLTMGASQCGDGDNSDVNRVECSNGSVPSSITLCSSDNGSNEGESNDVETDCSGSQPQIVLCGGTLVNIEENDVPLDFSSRRQKTYSITVAVE